jgi:hypothetical protein
VNYRDLEELRQELKELAVPLRDPEPLREIVQELIRRLVVIEVERDKNE